MRADITDTDAFREVEAICRAIRRPGEGLISDASEVSAAAGRAVFTGAMVDELVGAPQTRICLADLASGDIRVVSFGPNADRSPKLSPDGRLVGFLSDRGRRGDFQALVLDLESGVVRRGPQVEGWVEYLHWSPDGQRLLLGVAGHGADLAGFAGAMTSRAADDARPAWAPRIETGAEAFRWRRAWIWDLASGRAHPMTLEVNVWEAVWCGPDAILAVVSDGPGEGEWYRARLMRAPLAGTGAIELHRPRDQIGCLAASPSGGRVAFVEGVASDRGVLAGDLRLIDGEGNAGRRIDTLGADVGYCEWRSEHRLQFAGHRGFETSIGLWDGETGASRQVWASAELGCGWPFARFSGVGEDGDCALIGEGFLRAPELAVLGEGTYRVVRSFDVGYGEQARAIAAAEPVAWTAPDGLEIQGWRLAPRDGAPPCATVMNVHGGPVAHWHPVSLGRSGASVLALAGRGYQLFLPNPRGSTGRGQDFVRRVIGDMGGADAQDLLSGLDHLTAQGLADPGRIAVTGVSYGGFMSSWLITQDRRFAAAVPISPVTNQVSARLLSNIPDFMRIFLADNYREPDGPYHRRSPIFHVHGARTPTLNVCGALDRCTPPEEAAQFHAALLESGVESALLTYPEEGHGVRSWPASIDLAARMIGFLERHMPAHPPV